MKVKRAFLNCVDMVNEWTGRIFWVAIIPLVLIVTVDVTLRYLFNNPLDWGLDICVMLAGTLTMMGLGYTLLNRGHIGVDVLEQRLSNRAKAIVSLITTPVFFISIGALLWIAVPSAIRSVAMREDYPTYLHPPIYPYRIIMLLGLSLLFLQGIARFIRDLEIAIRSGSAGEL